uniref:Uncharacterized protein n=1 Tax=Solanum lycopersicum TaxID=4081 RepID=A0A3Q7I1S1_SOLLC
MYETFRTRVILKEGITKIGHKTQHFTLRLVGLKSPLQLYLMTMFCVAALLRDGRIRISSEKKKHLINCFGVYIGKVQTNCRNK